MELRKQAAGERALGALRLATFQVIDSLMWTETIPLNGTGQLYIIIEGEKEGKLKGNMM